MSNRIEDKKVSKEIDVLLNKCNNFSNPRTPQFIISFISSMNEINFNDNRLNRSYVDLVTNINDYNTSGEHILDTPTYDEYSYFYSMFHRNKLIDQLYGAIEYNQREVDSIKVKISQATTEEEITELKKSLKYPTNTIKNLMKQYDDFSRVVLKYANEGMNRVSREKTVETLTRISLNDLHQHVVDVSPKVMK